MTKTPFRDGLWYVSTSFATFGVAVQDGKIIPDKTAPIGRRFAYQPFANLVNWLTRKDPGFGIEHLLGPGERTVERET